MSSEVRLVRPYAGVETYQDFLEQWRLCIADIELKPNARGSLEATSFVNDPFKLSFSGESFDAAVKEVVAAGDGLGFAPEDLALVVVVSTPYLRLSRLLGPVALDTLPAVLPLDRAQLEPLRTPHGGCDVELAIVLTEHLEPAPLRPRRRGTWLGRVRFHARTELGEVGFTPLVLNEQIRSDNELPANTVRFIEVEVDGLLEAVPDDAVRLYVDDQVLSTMNQSPQTPAARSFQRQLFMDVMAAIVRVAPKVPDFDLLTTEAIADTLLGRVVATAARALPELGAGADEKALHHLRHRPEVFIALLEDAVKPRDDLRHAIGGI